MNRYSGCTAKDVYEHTNIAFCAYLWYNMSKVTEGVVCMVEKVYQFAIVISFVFLLVIFIEILIKFVESFSRIQENFKIIKGLSLATKRKIFLRKACKREEVMYRSYLLYNTLYFMGAFLSLEYAIATTATLLLNNNDVLSQIWMPLISMTFTVVSVCVKPQSRANQYLLAWRKYEAHTLSLLQQNYEKMSEDEILSEFEKSIQLQMNIEGSLKHDEIKDD